MGDILIKKGNTLLVEVFQAIELERKRENKKETIDAKIEDDDFIQSGEGKIKFDYSTNLIDKQIDYSELFSYFEGEAKENPYLSYESVNEERKQEKEIEIQESISYEEVDEVIQTKKFNDMLSRSELFQMSPAVKERFDWFKIFNKAYLALLYDMA